MLEGWEWIIIGVVAIVIIMWGPSKIPQFARALGRAKGEFNQASKEFNDAANVDSPPQPVSTNASPAPSSVRPVAKTNDQVLFETAKKLGVSTDGKTRQQLSDEISLKVQALSAE